MRRLRLAYRDPRHWLRLHRNTFRRVGLALGLFLAAFFFTQWWDLTVPALGRGEYQAVFLANGQTYFGRYYDRIGAYAKIEDVYYLEQSQGTDPNAAPDTRLVRRAQLLYEPGPRMLVPKSAILFVEDLADSSPIAQFMQRDGR